MQVYLLRHGIAEDGQAGRPDSERALVPEGRRKLKDVFKLARQADTAVSLVLTSPYKRARQTAEMVLEYLSTEAELLECSALTPDATPVAVWGEIRALKDIDSILLASHEPLLSATAAFLLNSPSLAVDFKKGALMRIDVESFSAQPHGVLRWMITARVAGGVS
jgi:phosphohistidine phosphatase